MVERWARTSVRGMKLIVATLLAVMTALILLQVFFRYVLNSPLVWAEELARLNMIWMAFLGAAWPSGADGISRSKGLKGACHPAWSCS